MSANGAQIKAMTQQVRRVLDTGVPGFKAEKLPTRAGVAPSRAPSRWLLPVYG
jgi:hypothetical protein